MQTIPHFKDKIMVFLAAYTPSPPPPKSITSYEIRPGTINQMSTIKGRLFSAGVNIQTISFKSYKIPVRKSFYCCVFHKFILWKVVLGGGGGGVGGYFVATRYIYVLHFSESKVNCLLLINNSYTFFNLIQY